MKISFTNTISQISDKNSKLNTSKILNAIGHDTRIGKNIFHWVHYIRDHVFLETT